MFITQEEIDQFFLADSVDSRLAVYSFFCYPHTKEEQHKFIPALSCNKITAPNTAFKT